MSGSPEISSQPISPEISTSSFTNPEVKTAELPAIAGADFITNGMSSSNGPPESLMNGFLQLPDTIKPVTRPDVVLPSEKTLSIDQRKNYRAYMKNSLQQFKEDNPNATYQEQITFMSGQKQDWETTQGNMNDTADQGRITENKRITTAVKVDEKIPITYQTYNNETQSRAPENNAQLTAEIAQLRAVMETILLELQKLQQAEQSNETNVKLITLITQIVLLSRDISAGITAIQSESRPKGTAAASETPPTYTVVEKSPPRQLPDLQKENKPAELPHTPLALPDFQANQGIPIEMPTKTPEMVMASGRK